MGKLLVMIFLMGIGVVQAQVKADHNERNFFNFFRIKQLATGAEWLKSPPALTTISTDRNPSVAAYWQGMTYTSYSVNGRFRSIHFFDVQGVLRESRASFSLKKSGMLSWWRVQFSPQRNRPLFIYTIH